MATLKRILIVLAGFFSVYFMGKDWRVDREARLDEEAKAKRTADEHRAAMSGADGSRVRDDDSDLFRTESDSVRDSEVPKG